MIRRNTDEQTKRKTEKQRVGETQTSRPIKRWRKADRQSEIAIKIEGVGEERIFKGSVFRVGKTRLDMSRKRYASGASKTAE